MDAIDGSLNGAREEDTDTGGGRYERVQVQVKRNLCVQFQLLWCSMALLHAGRCVVPLCL